jgi:hypothetical protein
MAVTGKGLLSFAGVRSKGSGKSPTAVGLSKPSVWMVDSRTQARLSIRIRGNRRISLTPPVLEFVPPQTVAGGDGSGVPVQFVVRRDYRHDVNTASSVDPCVLSSLRTNAEVELRATTPNTCTAQNGAMWLVTSNACLDGADSYPITGRYTTIEGRGITNTAGWSRR